MILDKQFLFIIGSPRSGTTWLQAMIGAHPLVCTTVELTLFSQYTAPWIREWNREAANIAQERWHQGLPFLWNEDEFYGFLREFLERVYERVAASNTQATHILDKHPEYAIYVEDINKLLPQARYIHLIRDGRDVALSMVAARRRVGFGTGTVPDSATVWKRNVQAAQDARQYQDRYLEVRYEELLANGADVLESVFDFCDLPVSSEEIADIVQSHQFEKMKAQRMTPNGSVKAPEGAYWKGKAGNWREEMSPVQRYLFHRTAGDLLHDLGYAKEGWWADSILQRVALPALGETWKFLRRVPRAAAVLLGPALTKRIKEAQITQQILGNL